MADSEYLALYFPFQGKEERFVVDCPPNRFVSTAVRQALIQQSFAAKVPVVCFKLFNFPRDPIETLNQRVTDALPDILEHKIEVDQRTSAIWPNGPDVTESLIDILVFPDEDLAKRAAIAALPETFRSRYPGTIARNSVPAAANALPSPSTMSLNPQQLYEHAGMLAGRPSGRYGPPTSIFNTHLAGLADMLRNLPATVPVPATPELSWARNFFTVALNFYKNETELKNLLRPLLDELFPKLEWQQFLEGRGAKSEAHGPGICYELKLTPGVRGDPQVQCTADFTKMLGDPQTTYGRLRDHTNLPTVLIGQSGPRLTVAVAAYVDVVLVDNLYSIELRDGFEAEKQIVELARLATCLSDICAQLASYYDALLKEKDPPSPVTISGLHLPAPVEALSPYPPLCHRLGIYFLYKMSRISGQAVNPNDEEDVCENRRHAVYVAQGTGKAGIPAEEVVVKFSTKYNTAAHTILAAQGLAPKLYFHGATRGGLLMTVMEKIPGVTAFRWISTKSTSHSPAKLPLSVYYDIRRAIELLHWQDLVFGDLRLPNIMVGGFRADSDNGGTGQSDRGDVDAGSKSDTDGVEGSGGGGGELAAPLHGMLVDFDWTAGDGVGRYPATIALSKEFDPTIGPYDLMSKQHDLHGLQFLRRKCLD